MSCKQSPSDTFSTLVRNAKEKHLHFSCCGAHCGISSRDMTNCPSAGKGEAVIGGARSNDEIARAFSFFLLEKFSGE